MTPVFQNSTKNLSQTNIIHKYLILSAEFGKDSFKKERFLLREEVG